MIWIPRMDINIAKNIWEFWKECARSKNLIQIKFTIFY